MGQPLPLFIVGRPAEYDANTTTERLFDGAGNSYWATPPNVGFPQVITLQLQTPAMLEQVMVNGFVPGYENCGPSDVGVEVSMAGNPNAWFAAGRGFVPMGATGSIPVQAPGPVDGVRIVIQANHGGPLLCAAEIAVIGNPAGAAMPNFGAPGGKFAPMESTKLGWQPPKEDVSGGKDWVHPDAGKAGWNDPYAKAGASMGKSDEWNDPYAKAGAPMAKSDWNDSGGKQTWQEQKANAPAYESTKVGWTPPQDDGFSGGKMAAGPAGVGARVVAERYDGGWFEGTVRQSNAGMYEVAWDDGSPPQWLKAEQVQFQ